MEGLIHSSELTEQSIEHPEEVVTVGDQVLAKVLRIDIEDRKIGLSLKRVDNG